jgi:hypothetical protein
MMASTPERSTTLDDHGGIGRDHDLIHDSMFEHALDDPGHQRLTGQELERFIRESGGAQPGRNNTKDAHDRS